MADIYLYMKRDQTGCCEAESRSSCLHFGAVPTMMCSPVVCQFDLVMHSYGSFADLGAVMTDMMMIFLIDSCWILIVVIAYSISFGKCPVLCPNCKAL